VGGGTVSAPKLNNVATTGEPSDDSPSQTIILKTTPGEQIPGHIAVNARCRTCGRFLTWAETPDDFDIPHCECPEPAQIPVFGQQNEYAGKTVAICGAGPSLKDAYRQIRKSHHVWAANRAAHYLNEWNWRCTHAFAIDAGTAMFNKAWKTVPKVSEEFILATSVHPKLVDHVLESGNKVRFFHSVRGGVEDEFQLYAAFFPPAPIAGEGLNAVNRAIVLADWLGYKRIFVCGADNALKGDEFYADGGNHPNHDDGAVYLKGEVHGRKWTTTPDMLMSATNLARMSWRYGSRVELVGNTLPRALARTSDEFLDRCVRWASDEEKREAAERLEAGGVKGATPTLVREYKERYLRETGCTTQE
jgi:hypothetical protein